MLVQFKVENYRSFKNETILSFISSKDKSLLEENTFEVNKKFRLNKTTVLYGANASGKSNIFKALHFFMQFACFSGPRNQVGDEIGTKPFILSSETIEKPSSFEMIFFIRNADNTPIRYRYGFTIDKTKIFEEYLFAVTSLKENSLFYRNEQEIECSPSLFKEGNRILHETVRKNATFLSVCAQANGQISGNIISYFRDYTIFSGYDNLHGLSLINDFDTSRLEKILRFLHYADLQIEDLKKEQVPFNFKDIPDNDLRELFMKKIPEGNHTELLYGHPFYEGNSRSGLKYISDKDESAGTNRLFDYSAIILDVLEKGGILFIDEFDSSLHPLIVESLIKIFNSPEENPLNAQLFVSCHSVNIMNNKLFRRDQIWFCEKDRYGASDLYSLFDFDEPVRKDASYNKNYLAGKYGAVPSINEIRLKMNEG